MSSQKGMFICCICFVFSSWSLQTCPSSCFSTYSAGHKNAHNPLQGLCIEFEGHYALSCLVILPSPQLEDSLLCLSVKLGNGLGAGRGAVKLDPEKVASDLTGTHMQSQQGAHDYPIYYSGSFSVFLGTKISVASC